ncbi:ABC transporter ATP-binding protein [Corticibacter populi]|uniref:ABC transporter ATP-binding protein n=1 Tax=Corticibacter populi TaxID=1550736 RepID=A0A3M6QKP1_9BURK|nr:ABC transporter ATP-binding protein [Corticibacter populi]RMX03505.1 ABC transporter ATP-binding protein [Corticibacter populi]RZS29950.1 putative spermidine/putrescine transport system ATP-binding protein [Corticibacter populi]
MSFLTIKGLGKRFGDFVAVDQLDLEVERGEFVSLLGPSGCGKTTTLQMVAGFIEPSRGTVSVAGRDITRLRPEKRGMGIVFQSYALFPHMTVEQNIAFGLQMRGLTAAEQRQRIDETLALVRLQGLQARYPRELSGGQRQRVAIARALAIRPEVLLLDEPMSNLDAKLREEMHIEMRAIQRHLGITTILVTHDQVEAMTMSDRIAVMHGGRIVQLDTPYGAYEHPKSNFASTFLGKTNRLEAQAVGSTAVQVETVELPSAPHALHGAVHAYIRPEKIRVLAPGQGRWPGTVKTKLFLGSHWMLEVETALGPLRVSVPNSQALAVEEGGAVALDWRAEDLRVLPRTEAAHV